jgi:hypothetical protein
MTVPIGLPRISTIFYDISADLTVVRVAYAQFPVRAFSAYGRTSCPAKQANDQGRTRIRVKL